MKTYKNLYAQLVSEENIRLAIHNASLGKKRRPVVWRVLNKGDKAIPHFQKLCDAYKNHSHVPKEIYDGITRKKRTIIVPTFDEQVTHHMVVNVLKPIFMKSMYTYSCGSIPGRGAHKAKKKIEKWLKMDVHNTKYCLKMDVRHFFDTIPHDILKSKLARIIKDERFLKVLFEIIDIQKVGIPLGFYTSQWLANFYLTGLDHFIKEKLGATYYVRYMDDMVILGSSKRKLHKIREDIEAYLKDCLGLEMKDNWQVFSIEHRSNNHIIHGRPLDFMGFRFYHYKTTLRRSIMLRASRKARSISKMKRITVYSCRQTLSYIGWISVTNTYGFYLYWIKPYVDIQLLKRKISKYERTKNKCGMIPKAKLCPAQ